jgi:membrane associated rhomboid family serine protease
VPRACRGASKRKHGCCVQRLPLTLPVALGGYASVEERVSQREPMFNVPGSVVAVIGLLVLVQVVRSILPEAAENWLTVALAFIPARYSGYAEAIPGGDVAAVTSFLTYALVHGNFLHLAINSAWLVAFGAAVADRIGALRFLLFSAFCAIAGAVTFLVLNPGLVAPMVGASGAVSGLMGGTMRFLFSALDKGGLGALRDSPQQVPLMPLGPALMDRRVLLVTGAFLLANLLGVFGFGSISAGGIAWEAHLGGYFAGLISFGFFEPPPTRHSPGQGFAN